MIYWSFVALKQFNQTKSYFLVQKLPMNLKHNRDAIIIFILAENPFTFNSTSISIVPSWCPTFHVSMFKVLRSQITQRKEFFILFSPCYPNNTRPAANRVCTYNDEWWWRRWSWFGLVIRCWFAARLSFLLVSLLKLWGSWRKMMSNMHVSELLAKLSMMVTEEEKKAIT